ncbi:MAG TPA: hypothetical protein VFQ36_02340 [Ktedonobacteraceae bacterium]|nr:hypothetical protein [Ktedonobacteraceae bacterium]
MNYHTSNHHLPSHFSRSRLVLGVCSLFLVCLLAACGSGGSSTGATSVSPSASTPTQQGNQGVPTNATPISCSLVSEATVSQTIGIQLAPSTVVSQFNTPAGDGITCIYKDAATSQIQEVVISYYSGSSASQSFDSAMNNTATADRQPISGLGDKAFFDTQRFRLQVLKGDLFFIVSLVKLSEQGASRLLPEARQIATAILANA